MPLKWRTKIAFNTKEETYIRGYPLTQMIGKLSFSEAIYLLLKGELPTEKEKQMFDAIFVSVIEHGVAPPSVMALRNVISGGNPLHVGVAAGVLTFGDYHGGALEDAMRFLQEYAKDEEDVEGLASRLAEKIVKEKWRVSGFGHKYYKDFDPRTKKLMDLAKNLGFFGKHCRLATALEEEIAKQKGKKLVLNVDGAIAAITSDMGFHYKLGKGFFIIGRIPGLVAHAFEELTEEPPFRRLDEEEIEYLGHPPRNLE
ncbi:MAG: citryl-CoA lyase [Sulfurihydrogenibium sp.]|uniref:citryl-CoA lyase n=1 Tax=Sulfurihydrogenibium sp. TaxID=2053621 RepID=UPI000CC5A075|nr:MAG: citryl-CoA lyase [Sulfurihydrogenibium sp.]PMP77775.1 MAG: citryl-CoA lyase [Sulfurihydrogenibium sp.]